MSWNSSTRAQGAKKGTALSRRGVSTMVTPSARVNAAANRASVLLPGVKFVSWTKPSFKISQASAQQTTKPPRLA